MRRPRACSELGQAKLKSIQSGVVALSPSGEVSSARDRASSLVAGSRPASAHHRGRRGGLVVGESGTFKNDETVQLKLESDGSPCSPMIRGVNCPALGTPQPSCSADPQSSQLLPDLNQPSGVSPEPVRNTMMNGPCPKLQNLTQASTQSISECVVESPTESPKRTTLFSYYDDDEELGEKDPQESDEGQNAAATERAPEQREQGLEPLRKQELRNAEGPARGSSGLGTGLSRQQTIRRDAELQANNREQVPSTPLASAKRAATPALQPVNSSKEALPQEVLSPKSAHRRLSAMQVNAAPRPETLLSRKSSLSAKVAAEVAPLLPEVKDVAVWSVHTTLPDLVQADSKQTFHEVARRYRYQLRLLK